MFTAEPQQRSGRETRLLLVTIIVSAAVLLLLAQFRFPDEVGPQPVEPAPAPLERLAARGAYDELASAMADLERRIAPRVVVFRVQPARSSGEFVVAPRVTADRAVALLGPDETLAAAGEAQPAILGREFINHITVLGVSPAEDAIASPRAGQPRQGPRYVVAVEGTPQGLSLRPVYVGRVGTLQESAGASFVALSGLQSPLARGTAVFTLEGAFLGLVTETGTHTRLLVGEFLTTAAQQAQAAPPSVGDFGVEVQSLTDTLRRATGATRGVMVSFVRPDGRATGILQPADVVLSVQGTAVDAAEEFREAERMHGGAPEASLAIIRAGKALDIVLPSALANPVVDQTLAGPGIVGRSVPNIGIEVVAVTGGSAAAKADLRRGDLLVFLNNQNAPTIAMLERAYRAAKPGAFLLLGVNRDQRQRVVALEKR
jgi:S1-C subfamily serine protease